MIVVFDAQCLLCNGWVRFLLRHDRQGAFQFASIQGTAGQALLEKTVLKAEVVYPGANKELVVEKPKEGGLGVYFLFTKPGEHWKTARNAPLPDKIAVTLGTNQIDVDE